MNDDKKSNSFKIISIFLIIIGLFISFFLGYIIKDFPYFCAIGGFILMLIGCFFLYLIKENDKKFKKYEQKLIENNKFSAAIFLFIGILLN